MSTSIYELFRYSLFPGLSVAFTYNKKEPPVFSAAPAFWCILLSLLGLSFCHILNNLSNDNELTANAPFFYQISRTWHFPGSREGKRTHPLLHLARDDKERASSISEQRIDGALGIDLFFSPFLSASSDPFIKNDEWDCGTPLAANAEGRRQKKWKALSLCWMR
ncbi:hypothetical protein QVD17_24991 [Tagetes erecta]|uniref:Uncharacterized protein n=1 Tax=Tagetes erecta TaxID=13708 RepID=A0AAD8KFP7_TARER|nr:hypothetical protein QVD17_24991 [Tagetes erecta]